MSQPNVSSETPVYVFGRLYYQKPICPFSLDQTHMVSLSFWSNHLKNLNFLAYRCTKTVQKWQRTYHPVKAIWDFITGYERLTTEACNYMIQQKLTPNAMMAPLHRINSTHFASDTKMTLNNTVLHGTSNWNRSLENFQLQLINITVHSDTGFIYSTDVPGLEDCLYSASECRSLTDRIVWNAHTNETCDVTKQESTQCYLSSAQLICPELFIAVVSQVGKLQQVCGTHLGVSRLRFRTMASRRSASLIDPTTPYVVDLDFSSLLRSIKPGQQQKLHLYHIASCSSFPTTTGLRQRPPVKDNETEWVSPVLSDRLVSLQTQVDHGLLEEPSKPFPVKFEEEFVPYDP